MYLSTLLGKYVIIIVASPVRKQPPSAWSVLNQGTQHTQHRLAGGPGRQPPGGSDGTAEVWRRGQVSWGEHRAQEKEAGPLEDPDGGWTGGLRPV